MIHFKEIRNGGSRSVKIADVLEKKSLLFASLQPINSASIHPCLDLDIFTLT